MNPRPPHSDAPAGRAPDRFGAAVSVLIGLVLKAPILVVVVTFAVTALLGVVFWADAQQPSGESAALDLEGSAEGFALRVSGEF